MLILLPPSESKRDGGAGDPLDLDALALPSLRAERDAVVDALVRLSADPEEAVRVLKLSARQRGDLEHNARLRVSATMPAVERYTGVLFDALDAGSLDATARHWLAGHVMIHSAPFGPVGALDPIPAYRLSAAARLPDLPSLKKVWSSATTAALATVAPGFVLDLRSEAYVALGPVPSAPSVYVRVVAEGEGGVVRALNHFNKHAKGMLVRQLAEDRPSLASVDDLTAWAAGAGWRTAPGRAGEIHVFA